MSINKSINRFFILFAFLLPFGKPVLSAVLVLLILLWIFEGHWREKIEVFRSSLPFQLYMGFILFMGVSLLWSGGLDGGFTRHGLNALEYYLQRYVFGFMIIPMMMTSLKKEYVSHIISAFLASMFISELLSWSVFMGWLQLKHAIPSDPSPFIHHSFYSIFITISIFLILVKFNKNNFKYKIFYSIFLVSALSNLFINGGRLGQVAFFISFIIFIFIKYHVSLKLFIKSFIAMVILFTSMYFVSPNFHNRANLSFESIEKIMNGNYNSSWGMRWNMNRVNIDLVVEHPLIGSGIGGAKKAFLEKAKIYDQTEYFPTLDHVHNGYMQILIETGFVGLLLFLCFIYSLIKSKMKKDDLLIMSLVVVVYLVGFIGEPLFFGKTVNLLFNLFIGLSLFKSIHFSEKTL